MELLSAPGLAGIAILAVQPKERAAVLACLETPAGKPCRVESGQAPLRALMRLDGHVVDDVLVVARSHERLELHVHGAPAVLDQLDRHFGVAIVAAHSPAELLLREALCPEQFSLAVEQLQFDFAAELDALRVLPVADRAREISAAQERSRVAQALVEPVRVALIGQQNAGKSSLFNRLLFRERALTGATPGLTRDAIAEVTTLAGYPYELVDTAGEGRAESNLDAAAIESGRSWRSGAFLILVVDGSLGPQGSDRELAAISDLVVSSKSDLVQADWPVGMARDVEISAHHDSAEAARAALGGLLARLRGLPVSGSGIAAGPDVCNGFGQLGGFAALNEVERQQLIVLDADCSAGPSSA